MSSPNSSGKPLRRAAGFDFDVITDDPGKPASAVPPIATTASEDHRRDTDLPRRDGPAAEGTEVRDG